MAAPVRMTPMNVGPIVNAPVFDIRNGPVADAVNIYVRPTIPVGYRWVPVAALPPEDAITEVGAFIRSAFAQLTLHAPPGVAAAVMRKQAIAMGTARAVMTAYFRLTPGDLIPGELVAPVYAAGVGPNQARILHAAPNADPAMVAAANNMPDLDELERNVAAVFLNSCVGALPLQGYSLIMTGHHYLSDAKSQSRKAFDVVERQFWASATVAPWFADNKDEIRDAAWHKAGHPVGITLKHHLAMSQDVADMLTRAGAGSAAARLPALETELRAANSYRTLCATVRPLFQAYGGSLDFTPLADAVTLVELYPTTGAAPVFPAGTNPPAGVVDRTTALAYLSRLMLDNADTVAFCYGFYVALSEQNMMMGGAGVTDTLKASFSLKKLKNQSFASYVAGGESYRDYMSAKNSARMAGQYNPPKLTFQ